MGLFAGMRRIARIIAEIPTPLAEIKSKTGFAVFVEHEKQMWHGSRHRRGGRFQGVILGICLVGGHFNNRLVLRDFQTHPEF